MIDPARFKLRVRVLGQERDAVLVIRPGMKEGAILEVPGSAFVPGFSSRLDDDTATGIAQALLRSVAGAAHPGIVGGAQ